MANCGKSNQPTIYNTIKFWYLLPAIERVLSVLLTITSALWSDTLPFTMRRWVSFTTTIPTTFVCSFTILLPTKRVKKLKCQINNGPGNAVWIPWLYCAGSLMEGQNNAWDSFQYYQIFTVIYRSVHNANNFTHLLSVNGTHSDKPLYVLLCLYTINIHTLHLWRSNCLAWSITAQNQQPTSTPTSGLAVALRSFEACWKPLKRVNYGISLHIPSIVIWSICS